MAACVPSARHQKRCQHCMLPCAVRFVALSVLAACVPAPFGAEHQRPALEMQTACGAVLWLLVCSLCPLHQKAVPVRQSACLRCCACRTNFGCMCALNCSLQCILWRSQCKLPVLRWCARRAD